MAASGVRSSCDTVDTNWSFIRAAAASLRLRSAYWATWAAMVSTVSGWPSLRISLGADQLNHGECTSPSRKIGTASSPGGSPSGASPAEGGPPGAWPYPGACPFRGGWPFPGAWPSPRGCPFPAAWPFPAGGCTGAPGPGMNTGWRRC